VNEQPTISIVTVARNAAPSIEATLTSVLRQSYPHIEHVVVDGASTDGTRERIESCRDGIAKFVSEPDEGIYQAMNKGLSMAIGEFVLFLNADDTLVHRDAIKAAVAGIAAAHGDAEVYHGGIVRYDSVNGRADIWRPEAVNEVSLFRGALPHPATFYRRRVFDRVGGFDESYRIAGDYEWAVRAHLKHGCGFAPIAALVAVFTQGGVSSGPELAATNVREMKRTVAAHYSPSQARRCRIIVRFRKILGI
jgi:glycosyltransferase involved in cell wall biosynthesis